MLRSRQKTALASIAPARRPRRVIVGVCVLGLSAAVAALGLQIQRQPNALRTFDLSSENFRAALALPATESAVDGPLAEAIERQGVRALNTHGECVSIRAGVLSVEGSAGQEGSIMRVEALRYALPTRGRTAMLKFRVVRDGVTRTVGFDGASAWSFSDTGVDWQVGNRDRHVLRLLLELLRSCFAHVLIAEGGALKFVGRIDPPSGAHEATSLYTTELPDRSRLSLRISPDAGVKSLTRVLRNPGQGAEAGPGEKLSVTVSGFVRAWHDADAEIVARIPSVVSIESDMGGRVRWSFDESASPSFQRFVRTAFSPGPAIFAPATSR